MSRIRRPALVAAIALVALFGSIESRTVTPTRWTDASAPASRQTANIPPIPSGALTQQMLKEAEEDFTVDLYGNEVTSAVATYTIDDLGTLYEVHSPQTEVPRLGSPKS